MSILTCPSMQIPVYCISMADSFDRRSAMEIQFRAVGLSFVFIDAIQPDLSSGYPVEYDRCKRMNLYGYDMRRGEMGCFLSHRKAWEMFLETDQSICCVFEDDVVLGRDFILGLRSICNLNKSFDLIRLYGVFARKHVKLIEILFERWIVDYLEQPRGTQGYILTRQAATVLLEYTKTMYCAIDDMIDQEWDHGLKIYGVEPSLITEDSRFASTIGVRNNELSRAKKLRREFYRAVPEVKRQFLIMKKIVNYWVNRG